MKAEELGAELLESGDLEVLQLHFSAGGSSILWHLAYPGGALAKWRSPAGRAEWAREFEEAFEGSKFSLGSIPRAAEAKGPRWGALSVEALEDSGEWGRLHLGASAKALARRVSMVDKLDELAGSRSIRLRGQSLMPFCGGEELFSGAWVSESLGGVSLAEGLGRALALKEAREMSAVAGPGREGSKAKL